MSLERWSDARLRRTAALASLLVALLLTGLKVAAVLMTGSLAMLSSLVDSLTDLVASAITWTSVRIALRPPDHEHRFGHGKAESLSALAQAALVAGSAGYVLLDALERLMDPEPVRETGLGISVMLVAIVVTIGLVLFQRRVIRRTGSQAIAADSLHYKADLFTNLAVILALVLSGLEGMDRVDPLIGLLIAVHLVRQAILIGRAAIDMLMDIELPVEERERIAALVRAHPEVTDMHDLRTRLAGGTRFIELHVELPGEMTVAAAHRVTDALEDELRAAFPESEIIIHQEPEGLEDARLDHRIEPPATA